MPIYSVTHINFDREINLFIKFTKKKGKKRKKKENKIKKKGQNMQDWNWVRSHECQKFFHRATLKTMKWRVN